MTTWRMLAILAVLTAVPGARVHAQSALPSQALLDDDTPPPEPIDDRDIPPPVEIRDDDVPAPEPLPEVNDRAPFGDGITSPDALPAAADADRAPRSPARTTSAARAQSPWKISAGLGLATSLGFAPHRSLAGVASLDVGYRAFRVLVDGRYDFGASRSVAAGQVVTTLGGVNLALCGTFGRMFACGQALLASMHVSGRGFYQARTVEERYLAIGARIGYEAQVEGPWSLRMIFDGYVPTTRTSFYAGELQAWRTPVLAGSVSFVVMYTF